MKLLGKSDRRSVLGTLLSLAFLSYGPPTAAQSAPPDGAVYDYIVIGSGPGGGVVGSNLAKAGYSVLLLEAGDDSPSFGFGVYSPTVTWDFYVKHYPEGDPRDNQYSHLTWLTPDGRYWVGQSGAPEGSKLLGVYYPRGATLGGSSMINAMAVWLPSDSDWDYHAEVTGDDSWRAENMHKIFQKIERNNYLPRGTANHGFDGWFQTQMGTMVQTNWTGPLQGNAVMAVYAQDWNLTMPMSDLLIRDPNEIGPDRDQTSSIYGQVSHTFANGSRYSARDYVQDAVRSGANLTVSLTSLATRVLFDTTEPESPRATGVEYLFGKSLYKADRRRAENASGVRRTAVARREVIVSGGAFNSPQLLLLSGIGNATELEALGIPVVRDLPGVGRNLMDNQEMPIVGQGSPGGAPGAIAGVAMYKTKHPAHGERDMFLMGGPGFLFRGFWPNEAVHLPSEPAQPLYGVSMVKGSSVNNGGWVKLRSRDPTDTPEINFNHYAVGAEYDLEAVKDTVAWIRSVYRRVGITTLEPPCARGPDENGYCGEEDEAWIHKQTFGHHPTSTNRIGADDDPMAVLDSKFRVRGVRGLRVVDASAFARIPGVFPVVSTFMISQKASDDILAELEVRSR
ncbi:hypothetical protein VTH06DRAFT_7587 [Thermothelomyces fergusii]